jgi:hypothetical protein
LKLQQLTRARRHIVIFELQFLPAGCGVLTMSTSAHLTSFTPPGGPRPKRIEVLADYLVEKLARPTRVPLAGKLSLTRKVKQRRSILVMTTPRFFDPRSLVSGTLRRGRNPYQGAGAVHQLDGEV